MTSVVDPHKRLRAQIRAGRELLGMNQSDLAKALDVSLSKISRAESGETKSGDILLVFKEGLEKLGIRFTANGVETVEDKLEIIEGEGCYLRLLDDVLITLKSAKERGLHIMFASDRVSPPEVNAKYRILRQMGVSMKQLIEDGDTYIMGDLDEYRTIPSKYFNNIVTLVYDNKVAQVNGSETRITIQTDTQLARREKLIFQYFWETGSKPVVSTATERF
jgi:transcriptional regulator with XRE-family HTH domain